MGQTDLNSQFFAVFCRFSLIFADFRFSWELQHFGGADFRSKSKEIWLRSCLGVEISIRSPSEANFLEVCPGTPQTSKKSLQKRFHAEACPSTVLFLSKDYRDFEASPLEILVFRGTFRSI